MRSHPLPRSTGTAFTLLELIVVIVILGILAAIAVPTFRHVIDESRYEAAEAAARTFDREIRDLAAFEQAAPRSLANVQAAAADLGSGATATPSDDFDVTGQVTFQTSGVSLCLTLPYTAEEETPISAGGCGSYLAGDVGAAIPLYAITSGVKITEDTVNLSPEGNPTWRIEGDGAQTLGVDLIPVDTTKTYQATYTVKGNPANESNTYLGVSGVDADGKAIESIHHMYITGTTTTLAQDLHPGDTVVHLADAANWVNTAGTDTHHRRFIIWEYTDGQGKKWPVETYSRIGSPVNAWADGGVDTITDTITLTSGWATPNPARTDGVWPAGTQLSNGSAGSTYKYIAYGGGETPSTWTTYSGEISGVDYSGKNLQHQFPPGTTHLRALVLANYSPTSSGSALQISGFSVKVKPAP